MFCNNATRNPETVVEDQDILAIPNTGSSPQIPSASSAADTRIEEEFKLFRSKFDAITSEQQDFYLIRQDLESLKLDRENLVLTRNDLDTLINGEESKDAGVAAGFETRAGKSCADTQRFRYSDQWRGIQGCGRSRRVRKYRRETESTT